MMNDGVERLSSRQRDCLRLLPVMGSSKRIAEELKIAPGTVDQHLKAARRILGVSDSWTAAQIVLRHPEPIQKLDIHPRTVGSPALLAPPEAAPDEQEQSLRDNAIEPDQAATPPPAGAMIHRPLRTLLFPTLGRPPNDLDIPARLSLIALQAVIAVGAVSVLFVLVFAMSRFLVFVARNGG